MLYSQSFSYFYLTFILSYGIPKRKKTLMEKNEKGLYGDDNRQSNVNAKPCNAPNRRFKGS